jgi:sirohydrochlorin cobaltochelatase
MSTTSTKTGILLFAHGARDPAWALPFEAATQALRRRAQGAGHEVVLAFLEFMDPDIRAAGQQLARHGCTEVKVVPLFLGAGGHVRKDLPALLAELGAAFPAVQWTLTPAVGETEILIQALADAAWALAGPAPSHPN